MPGAVPDRKCQLSIDRAQCNGHGRCYSLAPALVDPDDDGYPVIVREFPETAEDITLAQAIVASCPEQAISLNQVF
jgi:ferredoxin